MEARGRGRGYGRARGQPGQQQQQQQRPGGPQQPRPQQPRPQQPGGDGQPPRGPPPSGWVRPAQPATAWPRPQQAQVPQMGGRGAREAQGAIPRAVQGGGDQGNQAGGAQAGAGGQPTRGRGEASSVRGRVNRNEIVFTKPAHIQTKQGSSGQRIMLVSNYLPLVHTGKWCLYQYRVDMAPDIDHTGKRKGLVRDATRDLFTHGYLFDGTVIYTPQRIPNDSAEVFAKDGEENVRISIRLVSDLAWGDWHYLQLFNIIIRKCLALMGLQQIGRNYFMPENKVRIEDHCVELWPGYFTSMRQHERDILLNVDLQFKFLRTDNVYDLLLECQKGRREFMEKVIGTIVLTRYNNKTYKVDDVDFSRNPDSTFKLRDGSEISYRQYFQQKYRLTIRVADQPILVSRSKLREIRAGMPETVHLIPELCTTTGLTDKQRENFHLMKALANHTRIGCDKRIAKLKEFAMKLHRKPEVVQELRRWDLGIGQDLVQVEGRVLQPETLYGGGNPGENKYSAGRVADWTKELRSRLMAVTPKMERLAVITPRKFRSGVQDFVQMLGRTAGGMRWTLGNPKIFDIEDERTSTYIQEVERVIDMAQPTLILIILPNNSNDRYSAIKKKCYVDRGVPTQMFVARNLNNKGLMSIATKVVIQMNCKIGGAPWYIGQPMSNLMVVGYDVCRDTANKKKCFSGFVASLERQMTRFFSMTSEHEYEEELSQNFAAFLIAACIKFKEQMGQFPGRIMIYRDGVGDGQLPYVLNTEVENIKKRLTEEIYKNNDLRMSFIVVSKRINTRIMLPNDNPPPGTVVDDTITLPEKYDFFIVSQCVRQGTVSPTSYNVIYDNMGLTPDQMQQFTYKLCHMYYNWSGTVRVPAPCQYAHKLAYMVAQNLHRPAHRDLNTVLYFL